MRNFSECPHKKMASFFLATNEPTPHPHTGMARVRRLRRKFKRRVVRKYKRYVRRGNKRGWRSRRTGRKKNTGGIPDKKRIVFKFTSRYEVQVPGPSGTASAVGQVVFAGNNLTDVITAATPIERPLNLAQWTAFYRNFRVFGAKIQLELIPLLPVDPALGPFEVLIYPCLTSENNTIFAETFSATAARPNCSRPKIFNYGDSVPVQYLSFSKSTKAVTYANGNDVSENFGYVGILPTSAMPNGQLPTIMWNFIVRFQYIRTAGTGNTAIDFVMRVTQIYYTQLEFPVIVPPSGTAL